jgi:AcrR family transcriptional regulator
MGGVDTGIGTPGHARRRNRRGQGEALRREILDAVNRLLMKEGSAEKLTIRAVAQEVGVAAPSIYLHFSDKTELIWTALSDKYAQLADVLRAADEGVAAEGARARLRAQVHAYCRFAMANPGHYQLMYQVRQPAVDAGRIGLHPARMVSGSLRAAVARCADAGCSLALPVEQLATTLWSGLHGSVALSQTIFSDASTEQFVLDMADGLLDSLITPPDAGAGAPREPEETPASRRIKAMLAPTEADSAR